MIFYKAKVYYYPILNFLEELIFYDPYQNIEN